MIRIGIVGENYYNDSVALKNLLQERYKDRAEFIPLLKGTTGDKLKSFGFKRILQEEINKKNKKGKINFIIFFHDLDGFPSEQDKIEDYQEWFYSIRLNKDLDILFLAIFESEALLLADINAVNSFYNTHLSYNRNPLFEKEPKEYLKRKTQHKYKQSDCAELFKLLNFDMVYAAHCHRDHPCFQSFIDELNEKLA